jgi:hypothetical protein
MASSRRHHQLLHEPPDKDSGGAAAALNLKRSVNEVVAGANQVTRKPLLARTGGLRELDDLLARAPSDLDDYVPHPQGDPADEILTRGNSASGQRAVMGASHDAAGEPLRPRPVRLERRTRQGTIYDRARLAQGAARRRRSERAAEFARALSEPPGENRNSDTSSEAAGAPVGRDLRERVVALVHAGLTLFNLPLGIVPRSAERAVAWLAIALAIAAPLVWLVAFVTSS